MADPQTGELILARNRVWRPVPESVLPARTAGGLGDPEPYVREGAVRELARRLADPDRPWLPARCWSGGWTWSGTASSIRRSRSALGDCARAGRPQARDRTATSDKVKAPEPEPLTAFRDRLQDGSEGPEMVWLPAGRFLMGAPNG